MANEKEREDLKSEEEIRREAAKRDKDANPDPITGAPGSHPAGTGIGAASAGVAGAAIGAVAGPVGAVAGAAIGAVVGGLAGHGVAEVVNPTEEHQYWRENYRSRPYVKKEAEYNEYAPAYEYGWTSHARYQGKTFEEVEPELEKDWEANRGSCRLKWSEARHPARESWERGSTRSRQG